jgi:hypothetical protein
MKYVTETSGPSDVSCQRSELRPYTYARQSRARGSQMRTTRRPLRIRETLTLRVTVTRPWEPSE